MMLPGIALGSGRRIFKFGSTPLLAFAGCRPLARRSPAVWNARMITPNGDPPSILCVWPVSSTTFIASNCNSSFGISNMLRSSCGCLAANCGCESSCA